MARTTTKRLDDALRLLRAPARAPVGDRRAIYAAGLAAMGWEQDTWSRSPDYWIFNKGARRIKLYPGDRMDFSINHATDFKPLPQKARRNIALAGQ